MGNTSAIKAIVFEHPAGDRHLLAIGDDWYAILGANGTREITAEELAQIDASRGVLLIRTNEKEWAEHEQAQVPIDPAN